MKLADAIDRFGVRAVLGRDTMSAGEIIQIRYCEYLGWAFRDRQEAENWAAWVRENPQAAAVLNEVERLANG